ncbi:hypothetical protein GCM10011491_20390 [Brucella endophytica]|uniref:Uncharacterized protein n=1 Tax=Brucella endophytica TaxID=1963359 RepID=A0A916SDD4_9HYPH|nr:hypothetical protein GCM10011491_20390 [Brucella endophytica]
MVDLRADEQPRRHQGEPGQQGVRGKLHGEKPVDASDEAARGARDCLPVRFALHGDEDDDGGDRRLPQCRQLQAFPNGGDHRDGEAAADRVDRQFPVARWVRWRCRAGCVPLRRPLGEHIIDKAGGGDPDEDFQRAVDGEINGGVRLVDRSEHHHDRRDAAQQEGIAMFRTLETIDGDGRHHRAGDRECKMLDDERRAQIAGHRTDERADGAVETALEGSRHMAAPDDERADSRPPGIIEMQP